MALQKSIELSNGFTANYIKISAVDINHMMVEQMSISGIVNTTQKQFKVLISIYKDSAARTDKQPSEKKTVYLQSDFAYEHSNILPAIYTLLKTLPEFSGAQDV